MNKLINKLGHAAANFDANLAEMACTDKNWLAAYEQWLKLDALIHKVVTEIESVPKRNRTPQAKP